MSQSDTKKTGKVFSNLPGTSGTLSFLAAIIIAGAVIRFYNLGYASLWLDEATTYHIATNSFAGIWQTLLTGEVNPPLFYWLEHCMLIFGNSEFVLRFIPALFGTLTIPVMYYLGREFLDETTGLLAAFIATISPFLMYYSQDARAYAPMLFFLALACLYYLKTIQKSSHKNWVIFGIFAALAVWFHFFALVTIIAIGIHALITQYRNIKPALIGFGLSGILCSPVLWAGYQVFLSHSSAVTEFGTKGILLMLDTIYQASAFSDSVATVIAILCCIGAVFIIRNDRCKGLFLVINIGTICVISYLLSFSTPVMPRYLIALSIFLFVGAAASYRLIELLLPVRRLPALCLAAIILFLFAPAILNYYSPESKFADNDWRGFSHTLQSGANPGDIIVTVPGYLAQPLDYYYSSTKARTQEYGATTIQDIEKICSLRENNTLYFVVTPDINVAEPTGNTRAWLENRTRLISQNNSISLRAYP